MNLTFADGGIQLPDIRQNIVNGLHILLVAGQGIIVQFTESVGIGVDLLGQCVRGGTNLGVIYVVPGLICQLLKGVVHLVQLRADDAKAVFTVAYLVQNRLDSLQAAQLGVHGAHVGHLAAVADVQIGVPQLGHAGTQHAISRAGAERGIIPVGATCIEAALFQPLTGVSKGIDIRNIISGDTQSCLRRIDCQPGLGIRTKCTNRIHRKTPQN